MEFRNLIRIVAMFAVSLFCLTTAGRGQGLELWTTAKSDTSDNAYIVKYAKGTTSALTIVATLDYTQFGTPNGNLVEGTSDTVLFGGTSGTDNLYPSGGYGVIYQVNTVTGVVSKRKVITSLTDGSIIAGELMKCPLNGLYYGMTCAGGTGNKGVIFEWNPTTNVYTKKIDFIGTNGAYPKEGASLRFSASNGLFYGLTSSGGTSNFGELFSYNPVTNTLSSVLSMSGSDGKLPTGSPLIHEYPNGDFNIIFTCRNGGLNDYGTINNVSYISTLNSYSQTFYHFDNLPLLNNNEYMKYPLGDVVQAKELNNGKVVLIGMAVPRSNTTLLQRKVFTMFINNFLQLGYYTNAVYPSANISTDVLDFHNLTSCIEADSTIYGALLRLNTSTNSYETNYFEHRPFSGALQNFLPAHPQNVFAFPNGSRLLEYKVPCQQPPTVTITPGSATTCDNFTYSVNTTGFSSINVWTWKINGNLVGFASTLTFNSFNDGDVLTCQVIGFDLCGNLDTVVSAPITIYTITVPVPCGTTFNDGSGASNYAFYRDCSWLVQAPSGNQVTLSFSAFNTEANNDVVRIYDGGSSAAPLLAQYSGATIPASVTSTGNQLYVTFTTNGSVSAQGFTATATCGGSGGGSDLFISEYLEGTGNNKAIEIYNPGSSPINLSAYELVLYGNGSATASNSLSLTGSINPGDVYVIANPSAGSSILAQADVTSTVCTFNGDDAVALLKNGSPVDVVGVIGVDPGTNWSVSTGGATSEYTLVRMSNVYDGELNWTICSTEWLSYPQNTDVYLGQHQTNVGITDDAETVHMRVYPNPSGNVFFLESKASDPLVVEDIYLSDMNGRRIACEVSIENSGKLKITLQESYSGMLILSYRNYRRLMLVNGG